MLVEITEIEHAALANLLGKLTSRRALTRIPIPIDPAKFSTSPIIEFLPIPGRDYSMGRFPVTQAQYEAVMGVNPSHFKGDPRLPVETVSWDDAQEFCKKLSASSGMVVRLPLEAEWEHACRAGSTTVYCNGDTEADLDRVGWYYKNSDNKTHPVGQKQPNAWGLYDMHGNVWEWCADRHDSSGAARMLCGGSWVSNPGGCRSVFRDFFYPGDQIGNFGFRVVSVPSSRIP